MLQPPPLSDTWASAYLQILVGTLLFSLGIPAFIQQLASEDIRHLAQEQIGKWWLALPAALFAATTVLLLVFSNPSPNIELKRMNEWIAFGFVTFVPLALGVFLYSFSKRFNRNTVVKNLTRGLTLRYLRKGTLDEKLLRDLVSVGISGTGGSEKQLVLEAFEEIAKLVQEDGRYQGEELTKLVSSLVEILDDSERPGDGTNYLAGADFLRSILRRPTRLGEWLVHYDDAKAATQTLTELGRASIKSQRDRIVVKLLDIGVLCNSTMLFEAGVSALRARRFIIALYALNKLEREAETEGRNHDQPLAPGPSASRVIGLLSHFAAREGGARIRAQAFFKGIDADFLPRLQDCLREAHDYFYDRTDFQTADNIDALTVLLKASYPPGGLIT